METLFIFEILTLNIMLLTSTMRYQDLVIINNQSESEIKQEEE